MAASEKAKSKAAGDLPENSERPLCGIMMPISATANHSEQHWADVQKLLHRCISNAGFDPVNVWTNEVTERVSERIVGNIFSHDIIVADISDLNPNVMLELGLRLASRKPTIVIVNSGGTIPFDIRDFHALHYPSDLNILGIEEFFSKLEASLKSKFEAFSTGIYTPFLSNVVVDVLSPETREVPLEGLLLSRLDEISNRIARLDRMTTALPRTRVEPTHWDEESTIYLDVRDAPEDVMKQIEEFLDGLPNILSHQMRARSASDIRTLRIEVISGAVRTSDVMPKIRDFAGNLGIPARNIRVRVIE